MPSETYVVGSLLRVIELTKKGKIMLSDNFEVLCSDKNSDFLKVLRDTNNGYIYVAHVERGEVKAISEELSYLHESSAYKDACDGHLHMYTLTDSD